jgi:hypothetical protein
MATVSPLYLVQSRGIRDLPIFAPNNTLGTSSAEIGAFGVRMPSTVIRPPIRVDAMLFMSVPAPPVSMTWSTPLPAVSLRTSCSQAGVWT